jgi:eukaryotic translation initiation factor 2C
LSEYGSWLADVSFFRRYPTRQIDLPAVQHFVREFMKAYMGHGGRIECKTPLIHYAKDNPAEGVEQTWTKAKQHFKKLPQIILFVLPDRNGFFYFRIKKSCDCRFGVLSQCKTASVRYALPSTDEFVVQVSKASKC